MNNWYKAKQETAWVMANLESRKSVERWAKQKEAGMIREGDRKQMNKKRLLIMCVCVVSALQ